MHFWPSTGAQSSCLCATLPILRALLRRLPDQLGRAVVPENCAHGRLCLRRHQRAQPCVDWPQATPRQWTALRSPSSALSLCSAPGVRPVCDGVGLGEQRLARLIVKSLVAHIADLILCKARTPCGSETGCCDPAYHRCSQEYAAGRCALAAQGTLPCTETRLCIG